MKGVQLSPFGLFLTWLMVSCWRADAVLEFELAAPSSSLENGKAKISEMMKNSNLPLNGDGGSCWKSALEHLEAGCKTMSEEIQTRMTLRFTSCFNEMFGLPSYICEPSTPIQECMKQLDPTAMATFRDYFLHTQDMCYYLRQEVWQEQTNGAVTRLTDAATDVTVQMEAQKGIQEQIFESQQESLKVQSNMKKDNEDLYNTVVKVKDVFDDFSETAKEHRIISSDIFDKLSKMQKLVAWIQGEMSLLDMIFFYFAALIFGYFSTATTRTRAARFWLICLYIVGIFVEKAVYSYFTNRGFNPEDVQEYRWMVRKMASIIACLMVIVYGALYRDMQSVNNAMLMHMNLKLDKLLSGTKSDKPSERPTDTHQASLEMSAPQHDDIQSSDEYEDSFSNYSTDDSADNLESELKDLLQEDRENEEKQQPAVLSKLGRFFGREPNEKISPAAAVDRSRIQHTYNLRERSATPRRENPTYQHESTTEFARSIKKKIPKPTSTRVHYFSSDDEY